MAAQHFAWIKARIPVAQHWYTALHEDVVPFLKSADVIFLCDTWFYELSYRGCVSIDLYLYAEASAVHQVLIPLLKERFAPSTEGVVALPVLLQDRATLNIERWQDADHLPSALLGHYNESTQLYTRRRAHRRPNAQTCFDGLAYALQRLRSHSCDLGRVSRTGLQDWLTAHLAGRYSFAQVDERLEQEAELISFLQSQPKLIPRPLIGEHLDTWVAATIAVNEEGERYLLTAICAHMTRYGLEAHQVGLMWMNLYQLFASTESAAISTTFPSAIASRTPVRH